VIWKCKKNLRNGYIVVKRAVISRLPVIAGRSSSSPDAASRLQLNVRIAKSLAVVVGAPVALLLAGVAIFLITDYMAYQKVEITTALLRDGRYDPAEHFTFDRACTFPPESGGPMTFCGNVDIANWMRYFRILLRIGHSS
jgi:hypothetical protein